MAAVEKGQKKGQDKDAKDLEQVREWLRQAAEIEDPRAMWYAVRDVMNLLTMIVVPNPEV